MCEEREDDEWRMEPCRFRGLEGRKERGRQINTLSIFFIGVRGSGVH